MTKSMEEPAVCSTYGHHFWPLGSTSLTPFLLEGPFAPIRRSGSICRSMRAQFTSSLAYCTHSKVKSVLLVMKQSSSPPYHAGY